MAKIEPFDTHIDQYEEWFNKNRYAYQSELLAVKEVLPIKGVGIEIGVGSGRFAFPFGIRFGIEPSQKMRELAKEKGITVLDGTAEKMPLEDNSFDFALMVTTICFLDDIKKAFGEVFRILKDSGSVIIGFVDKESPLGRSYQKHKNKSIFYREAVFYSTGEVVDYLRKAGFTGFSFYQTIFRPPNKIKKIEPVLEGYGKGSFVVIKGKK
jgi:ubiquinone/menaquinone biosynthesis C-methylase UbiE